jgi:RND family efflux transporter MFP subunit
MGGLVLGVLALVGAMAALRNPLPEEKQAGTSLAPPASTPPASARIHKGWLGVVIAEESLDLAARVEGRVESVKVQVGSRVRQGEVLVTLDAHSLKADLEMAEAGLLSSKAEQNLAALTLEQASEKLRRRETPEQVKLQVVSEEELSAARFEQSTAAAKLAVAQAKVKEQEARVSQMRQQLAETSLRAPFDGVVAGRFVHPGAVARPGVVLLHLLRQGKPQVRFAIPEGEARSVAVGQAVEVVVAGRGQALPGLVTQLAPEVEVNTLMVFALANVVLPEGVELATGTEVRVRVLPDKQPLTGNY